MQNTGRSALWLLHYWWPLGVGWSFMVVAERAMNRPEDPYGVATLFFGIIAAYSLDRVFDRSTLAVQPRLHPLLTVVGVLAAGGCAVAAWHLPLHTSMMVPVLGAASLLYPRLKRLPVVKAVLLPALWIWAALGLPFPDGSWLGWHVLLEPVMLPLLLLNGAACLLCDLKDESRDRSAGVQSLPAVYGGMATARVASVLTLLAGGLAVVEHRTGILFGAAVLGAATFLPSLLATDIVGPLLVDVILTIPGVLIATRVL